MAAKYALLASLNSKGADSVASDVSVNRWACWHITEATMNSGVNQVSIQGVPAPVDDALI